MTFQLIDDAIDYSSNSETMGKNVGDDFKEGKITLPIILAYGRSNKEEKKILQNIISKPTEDEIRCGISGNLCRCTGYQNIVKAINNASTKLQESESKGVE